MKLQVLSGSPNHPSFLLRLQKCVLLIDCSLDIRNLLNYIPVSTVYSAKWDNLLQCQSFDPVLNDVMVELFSQFYLTSDIEYQPVNLTLTDVSQIDAVLISSYHCILGLPYLTQLAGFRASIYVTEPTMIFARLLMDELIDMNSFCSRRDDTTWKKADTLDHLPHSLRHLFGKRPHLWKKLYSRDAVEDCFARMKLVAFSEKSVIYGCVTVTACSSGYCLGSANWIVETGHEKFVYVASSSTLTTHLRSLDQPPLRHADVMLLSCLTTSPSHSPNDMVGKFCVAAATTLSQGGNVLVPVYPTGIIYDLIECLSIHLENSGLANMPIYFVSPVAKRSLQHSNIFSEWLSLSKQTRVYLPEAPFVHAELVRNGRLKHFDSIAALSSEFKLPCVVFTGHPSLRFGPVVHLLESWATSQNNVVIFTEPEFPYLEALAPFQPMSMKAVYYPINTALSFNQANTLVREALKPRHLVTSRHYLDASSEFHLSYNSVTSYDEYDTLEMAVDRRFDTVEIDPKLARSLVPKELCPGVAAAPINGVLVTKNNHHTLEAVDASLQTSKRPSLFPRQMAAGSVDIELLQKHLRDAGFSELKLEPTESGHCIHLENEDTLILIDEASTHVRCSSSEAVRSRVKLCLLKCLHLL